MHNDDCLPQLDIMHNDDCLPQLDIMHYFFHMFCDVELFQNFLGQTDKNQISILSSLQWVDKL